jgi:hypothetical protein
MLELDTIARAYPRSRADAVTLGHQLDTRLSRLLGALDQSEHLEKSLSVVEVLTRSWRGESISAGPRWPSDITDDHSPFEFSLSLNGSAEVLRVLTEPQDPGHPSLVSSWRLAGEIHEELARRWGVGLSSYDRVAHLFEPSATDAAAFSVWHSAILGEARETEFKVYLNPAIHGTADAESVASEALDRLELGDAWRALARHAVRRAGLDQVIYFSLDLSETSEARAKLYVAHRHATAQDVARALEPCPGFGATEVERWCKLLLGGRGPFHDRPPITCYALRLGTCDLHTTTLHLPVRRYAADDFEIARRICGFLRFPQRVSYMRAVTEFAERPLETGAGLQTYASLRASPGREAVTMYLAPEVYSSSSVTRRLGELTQGFFPEPQHQRLRGSRAL